MNLSDKDRKQLWSAAAGVCSYHFNGNSCETKLFTKNGEMDTNIGQECHIIGEKPAAARYQNGFEGKETYDNAILLCNVHHKLVDDNPELYTPSVLRHMKNEHERIISDKLGKHEISPLVLKDCQFLIEDTKVEGDAIALDVQQPAVLSGVSATVRGCEAKNVIGARFSGGLNITMTSCPNCGKPVSSVYTGGINPPIKECSYCHYRF